MTDVTPAVAQELDGTRARILAEAIDMFTRHGYHRTSLRQLADRLGITKAAILYHFPAKERILAAVVEPFIDAMEAVLDRAARVPIPECRTVLVEGLVDTYLDHRTAEERFIDTVRRIGVAPFKARVYAQEAALA